MSTAQTAVLELPQDVFNAIRRDLIRIGYGGIINDRANEIDMTNVIIKPAKPTVADLQAILDSPDSDEANKNTVVCPDGVIRDARTIPFGFMTMHFEADIKRLSDEHARMVYSLWNGKEFIRRDPDYLSVWNELVRRLDNTQAWRSDHMTVPTTTK